MSVMHGCNATVVNTLPSPKEVISEYPLSLAHARNIEAKREEVRSILNGTDSRYLLIIGPCSIHDISAAKDFAFRLKKISDSHSDLFLILMRTYFEKPRTALGWKGLIYDPFLNGTNDIPTGIKWARKLLLDLTEMGIPTATEFLEPFTSHYYGDLITWSCVGARTCTSPIHRQMASGLSMPTAFKNSIDGTVESAIHGIISASTSHTFMSVDVLGTPCVVQTKGNPDGHLVLRGGENQPNYDPKSISKTLQCLTRSGLKKRLLIDCSHDNSLRQHEKQIPVFHSALKQIVEGNQYIKGLLLESNIYSGNQPLHLPDLKYGVSLTDSCLDWSSTENLIKQGYILIKKEMDLSNPVKVNNETFALPKAKGN